MLPEEGRWLGNHASKQDLNFAFQIHQFSLYSKLITQFQPLFPGQNYLIVCTLSKAWGIFLRLILYKAFYSAAANQKQPILFTSSNKILANLRGHFWSIDFNQASQPSKSWYQLESTLCTVSKRDELLFFFQKYTYITFLYRILQSPFFIFLSCSEAKFGFLGNVRNYYYQSTQLSKAYLQFGGIPDYARSVCLSLSVGMTLKAHQRKTCSPYHSTPNKSQCQ